MYCVFCNTELPLGLTAYFLEYKNGGGKGDNRHFYPILLQTCDSLKNIMRISGYHVAVNYQDFLERVLGHIDEIVDCQFECILQRGVSLLHLTAGKLVNVLIWRIEEIRNHICLSVTC